MTDSPPDRLSVDPASPFYDEAALARGRRSLPRSRAGRRGGISGWIQVCSL